jgi:hypothetical protein
MNFVLFVPIKAQQIDPSSWGYQSTRMVLGGWPKAAALSSSTAIAAVQYSHGRFLALVPDDIRHMERQIANQQKSGRLRVWMPKHCCWRILVRAGGSWRRR